MDHSSLASIRLAAARILLVRFLEIPGATANDKEGMARFIEETEADTLEVVICVKPETIVDLGVDGLADHSILAFSSKELIID